MFSVRYLMLTVFISVLALTGCTRPQEEISSLSLALPHSIQGSNGKASESISSSSADLKHVIINITGPGIDTPIVKTWDSCQGCPLATSIPASGVYEIPEIPVGNDRLIQALAVYEGSSGTVFRYGDAIIPVQSSSVSATIAISALPTTDNLASLSSQVAGRYFRANGSLPTGEVHIRFDPGAGRQKLVIEKTKIVAGWFQFFMLDNVKFEYFMPATGEILFGGPVDINSPLFAPSDQVVKVSIPRHARNEMYPTPTWIPEEAAYYVWGYFGPSASVTGKKAWLASGETSGSLTQLKVIQSTGVYTGYLSVYSAPLHTKAMLLATGPTNGGINFVGGNSTNTGDVFVDYIPVKKEFVDGKGRDYSAGFVAPFQWYNQANYQLFSIGSGGSGKSISGTVLPGVPAVISRFVAFKKVGVGQNYYMESGSCSQIRAAGSGWLPAGDGTANNGDVNGATRQFTVNTNVSASDATAGTVVALCALNASGVMYESAAPVNPYYFMNNSPGGGNVLKLHMPLAKTTPNKCMPVSLKFETPVASTKTFDLGHFGMSWTGTIQFFAENDPSCGASPITQVQVGSGTTEAKFNVMITSSGGLGSGSTPSNFRITANAVAPDMEMAEIDVKAATTSVASDWLIVGDLGVILGANGACIPSFIFSVDGFGFPTSAGGSSVTINTSGSGATLKSTCGGAAITTFSGTSSEYKWNFVFMLDGNPGTYSFSSSSGTPYAGSKTIEINPAPIFDHMLLSTSATKIFYGDCVPFDVSQVDDLENPISTNPAVPFRLMFPHGMYFMDTACSAAMPSPDTSFPLNSSSKSIYFRASPGSGGQSVSYSVFSPYGLTPVASTSIPTVGFNSMPMSVSGVWTARNMFASNSSVSSSTPLNALLGMSYPTTVSGGSANFMAGANPYLLMGSGASIQLTSGETIGAANSSWTLMVRAEPLIGDGNYGLFSIDDSANFDVTLVVASGQIEIRVNGNPLANTVLTPYSASAFKTIGISYSSSGTANFYVDGALVGHYIVNPNMRIAGDSRILVSRSPQYYFQGKFGSMAILLNAIDLSLSNGSDLGLKNFMSELNP